MLAARLRTRQLLDQQPTCLLVISRQQQPRGQLLGAREVVLEAGLQALALERHDALIARTAAFGLHGHHEPAVAHQLGKARRIAGSQVVVRDGAQLVIIAALGDQHAHAAVAGQLQRERALELERRGQQYDRGGCLTEQSGDRRRVALT